MSLVIPVTFRVVLGRQSIGTMLCQNTDSLSREKIQEHTVIPKFSLMMLRIEGGCCIFLDV